MRRFLAEMDPPTFRMYFATTAAALIGVGLNWPLLTVFGAALLTFCAFPYLAARR
jgi:hypothetical protein